jgi:hypothetical protein
MIMSTNKGNMFKTFIVYSVYQKALLVYLDNMNHEISYTATYI